MYRNNIEIYFFEDDKNIVLTFTGDSAETVKRSIPELVVRYGKQYSMLSSEVVVSSVIEGPEGYVDSDEYFCSYNARASAMQLAMA